MPRSVANRSRVGKCSPPTTPIVRSTHTTRIRDRPFEQCQRHTVNFGHLFKPEDPTTANLAGLSWSNLVATAQSIVHC